MKDLFGKALLDYQTNNSSENIITSTSISHEDEMEVAYLFRKYDEMPFIERRALGLVRGKTLDVGCGAGSHSLYLQNKGIDLRSIDISENAIKVCLLRGLKNATVQHILSVEGEKFDTILLLMNGTGIFETIKKSSIYLHKLKELMLPGGQILIDSSDIIYMFDEEDKESISQSGYYGELTFDVAYKNEQEDTFSWLYLDFNTLCKIAFANGLLCERICEGEHFDYLARLSHL